MTAIMDWFLKVLLSVGALMFLAALILWLAMSVRALIGVHHEASVRRSEKVVGAWECSCGFCAVDAVTEGVTITISCPKCKESAEILGNGRHDYDGGVEEGDPF